MDLLPNTHYILLYLPVYDQLLPTQSVKCQVEDPYKFVEPGVVEVVQ